MSRWEYYAERVTAVTCAVVVVAAVLSGCTPTVPGIDSAAAAQLQASVSAVTQAAATGDPASAITALDSVEAQLRQGTASGAIHADRSARIQASIDLVRGDLTAALPAPSPTPVQQAPVEQAPVKNAPGKSGDKGKSKGDKKK